MRDGDRVDELSDYTWDRWVEPHGLLDAHGGVGHLVKVIPETRSILMFR